MVGNTTVRIIIYRGLRGRYDFPYPSEYWSYDYFWYWKDPVGFGKPLAEAYRMQGFVENFFLRRLMYHLGSPKFFFIDNLWQIPTLGPVHGRVQTQSR